MAFSLNRTSPRPPLVPPGGQQSNFSSGMCSTMVWPHKHVIEVNLVHLAGGVFTPCGALIMSHGVPVFGVYAHPKGLRLDRDFDDHFDARIGEGLRMGCHRI